MIIDVASRVNISWAIDFKYVEDAFDVFDHMCFIVWGYILDMLQIIALGSYS